MGGVDGRQKNPSTDADLQEIVEDIVADETVTTRKLQVRSCGQARLMGLPSLPSASSCASPPTNLSSMQKLYEAFDGKEQTEEHRLLSVGATRHLLSTNTQHTADKASLPPAPIRRV